MFSENQKDTPALKDILSSLSQQFSFDRLDRWQTTAELLDLVIDLIRRKIPASAPRIFMHEEDSKEYREIDRESIVSIPDDTTFTGCLSMLSGGMDLLRFFSEFQVEDPLTQELLMRIYGGKYIIPVIHRFSLLGFILLGITEQSQAGPGEPFLTEEDLDFLHRLSEHLQANFFAAKIADRRQKDLLNLASFPEILHKYKSGTDLLQNIIADLHTRIDFDFGICYRFDAAENILRPVSFTGLNAEPEDIKPGEGISGKIFSSGKPVFVTNREMHPFFSIISDESFISGSFVSAPIRADQKTFGVITIGRNRETGRNFSTEHCYALQIATTFIAAVLNNLELLGELENSYIETITALTRALEAKDQYTRGHSERVMRIAVGVAQEMNVPPQTIHDIQYAAILHDIGKIGISENIIRKTSRLTEQEYAEIKCHTAIGFEILSGSSFFEKIRLLVLYHHEKLNGTGYFAKKAGEYPPEVMIISISDIYDALSSNRPYRKPMEPAEAVETLRKGIGTSFSQEVFDAFVRWLQKQFPDQDLLAQQTGSGDSAQNPAFAVRNSALEDPELLNSRF